MSGYRLMLWVFVIGSVSGGAPTAAVPLPGAGARALPGPEDVVYVDDDAPPGGDGLSWETAFRFLQDALSLAAHPGRQVSEIRIAQGVYQPDRDESTPEGTGERGATFSLTDRLSLVGGYAGLGAEDRTARDPARYETVLTGDLAGDDGPDFVNNDENSFHVVFAPEGMEALIDGCTITAGNADGDDEDMFGGGIYNGAELTLIGCRIADNSAEYFGGIYSLNPEITAIDCVFSGNEGGAFRGYGGVFTGCLFQANHGYPGAVSAHTFGVTLFDCTFIENTAADRGGAVNAYGETRIIDCTFIGNAAGTSGGAVYSLHGLLTLENCIFEANTALEDGGAMRLGGFLGPEDLVVNCFFTGNHAPGKGGAVSIPATLFGGPTLADCLFTGNTAHLGGGLYADSLRTECTNCLFHANSAYHGGGMYAKGDFIEPPTLAGHVFLENDATEGGGLYVTQTEATFTDCVFEGNTAVRGGGMRVVESAPIVIDGTFTENLALLDGGGMSCEDSTIAMNGCAFTRNEASSGGGLSNSETEAVIGDCTFSDNLAAGSGGGLHRADDTPTIVRQCAFTGNEADSGGGIWGHYYDPPHLILAESYLCQNAPEHVHGSFYDAGGNEFCPLSDGDINGDGVIDTADLTLLLAAWGDCPFPPDECPADLNGDRRVDVFDLLVLLGNWG